MRKIKLLYIIDNLAIGGGAEQQLVNLASGLDVNIFELTICNLGVLSKEYCQAIQAKNVKIFNIAQYGFFDASCLIALGRLIGKIRPDIVNTFLFTADTYGRIAALVRRVPIIIASIRNVDLWKNRLHIFVDTILKAGTTYFTVNSALVKKYLIETYHLEEKKIGVIYNGVDLQVFNKNKPRQEIYTKLNIAPTDKIILNVARFFDQKDHYTLIRALKTILANRKDITVILIGDGELRDKVLVQIEKEGIRDYFRILEPQLQLADFYNIASLSILTSVYEGCSNFILESMACGLPVVATSVGGNSELISDGKTGFLVSLKDYARVAEKALFLLNNPNIAYEFGIEARRKVEENFGLEKMVKEYESLYLGLCSRQRLPNSQAAP
jgi:glycosyltransferase involved in cell wall biosynthesis